MDSWCSDEPDEGCLEEVRQLDDDK